MSVNNVPLGINYFSINMISVVVNQMINITGMKPIQNVSNLRLPTVLILISKTKNVFNVLQILCIMMVKDVVKMGNILIS